MLLFIEITLSLSLWNIILNIFRKNIKILLEIKKNENFSKFYEIFIFFYLLILQFSQAQSCASFKRTIYDRWVREQFFYLNRRAMNF